MFALRHKPTGKLCGFWAVDNQDGEFCVGVSYTLELDVDNVWVTTDKGTAIVVAETAPTEWFNATFSSPKHDFTGMLEVVELTFKES